MDIGAYQKKESLEHIAKENNIEVPRCRGYRLMKDEQPFTQEEIDEMLRNCEIDAVKSLCDSEPFWDPNSCCERWNADVWELWNYYLIRNPIKEERGYQDFVGIRWDRIHGWKRRILKFKIKQAKKAIRKQHEIWNKYAGQEGIFYIHARIGGNNWLFYKGDTTVATQSWFLEKVDDCFDSTYCDIYAKINCDSRNGCPEI